MGLINDENLQAVIEGVEGEIRSMLQEGEIDIRVLEMFATLLEINKYLVKKTK